MPPPKELTAAGAWKPRDGEPTRLLLVRHGEVHEEDRQGLYGQLDVRLSERGHQQSRRTGESMRLGRIAAVLSSDLQRAAIVAREIGRHHGIQPQLTPLLRERHFGHWQGLPWHQVEAEFGEDLAHYNRDRFHVRAPGDGENFNDVRRRVVAFLGEVLPRYVGRTIAVCAHSGPLRLLIAEAMGLPLNGLFNFDLDYCSLTVVDHYPSGRCRVNLLNGLDHLGELAVRG